MLKDENIDLFIETLSIDDKKILQALSEKEDWPVDDEKDVRSLIKALSEKLDDDTGRNKFHQISGYLMAGLMASLSLPRYSIILNSFTEKSKDSLINAIDIDNTEDDQHKLYQHTIYMRASFLTQYGLLNRMFSKERMGLILNVLLNNNTADLNDGIKLNEENENDEETMFD